MPANQASQLSPAGSDLLPKIAIPRLHDGRSKRKESNDINRVPRACAHCARRKIKCSAGQPRCRNCEEQDLECIYPIARKDRLQAVKEQNGELVQLLRELSIRASDKDKKKINSLLDTVEEENVVLPSPRSSNAPAKRQKMGMELAFDSDESSPASLPENLDLNDDGWSERRDSKPSGAERKFYSRSKEPSRTSTHLDALRHLEKSPDSKTVFHITDWAFYLDNDNFDSDVPPAEPLALPVPTEAKRLLDLFIETTHVSFPLISRFPVEEDLRRCYNGSDTQHNGSLISKRQRVNLNLIFAIASYQPRHTGTSDTARNDNHHVYLRRARSLGLLDSDIMTPHPDLLFIQSIGLLALYYLVTGHLSRAWVGIGLSLRFAMAIGLQTPDAELAKSEQDNQVRIWWGLRNIEFLLSSGTGRPSVTSDDYCTIPFPPAWLEVDNLRNHGLMQENGQSLPDYSLSPRDSTSNRTSLSTSITAYTRIGHITQMVVRQLYSPRSASKPCENIYPIIKSLKGKLDQWALAALPPSSASMTLHSMESQASREEIRLELYYASTMILITKPCLYHRRQASEFRNISSREFGQKMAAKCIEAAKRIVTILSNGPDWGAKYEIGPWWSTMHNMMQALTVFLHELSHENDPFNLKDDQISHCARKIIHWIYALRNGDDNDYVAKKAYQVVQQILKSCHGRVKLAFPPVLGDESRAGIGSNPSYQTLSILNHNHSVPSLVAADHLKASNSSTRQIGYVPFGPPPLAMDSVELGHTNWQYPQVLDGIFVNPFATPDSVPEDFSAAFSRDSLDAPSTVPHQHDHMNIPSNALYYCLPQTGSQDMRDFCILGSIPSNTPTYYEYGARGRDTQSFDQVNQMKQHQYFPY